jgi:hypothetical protein
MLPLEAEIVYDSHRKSLAEPLSTAERDGTAARSRGATEKERDEKERNTRESSETNKWFGTLTCDGYPSVVRSRVP